MIDLSEPSLTPNLEVAKRIAAGDIAAILVVKLADDMGVFI